MPVKLLTNTDADFAGRPRVLIVTGPGFQDHDVIYCGYRLREARMRVAIATADGGTVHGRFGAPAPLDKTSSDNVSFDELDAADYDAVIATGGYEAPDRVRQDKRATGFVARMDALGKPVGGLCHGPWVLISARIMAGRHAAAYPGLRDDLEFAGAIVEDAHVVVDDNVVTCSYYGEVGLFMKSFIELVEGGAAARVTA
jgi:protease I